MKRIYPSVWYFNVRVENFINTVKNQLFKESRGDIFESEVKYEDDGSISISDKLMNIMYEPIKVLSGTDITVPRLAVWWVDEIYNAKIESISNKNSKLQPLAGYLKSKEYVEPIEKLYFIGRCMFIGQAPPFPNVWVRFNKLDIYKDKNRNNIAINNAKTIANWYSEVFTLPKDKHNDSENTLYCPLCGTKFVPTNEVQKLSGHFYNNVIGSSSDANFPNAQWFHSLSGSPFICQFCTSIMLFKEHHQPRLFSVWNIPSFKYSKSVQYGVEWLNNIGQLPLGDIALSLAEIEKIVVKEVKIDERNRKMMVQHHWVPTKTIRILQELREPYEELYYNCESGGNKDFEVFKDIEDILTGGNYSELVTYAWRKLRENQQNNKSKIKSSVIRSLIMFIAEFFIKLKEIEGGEYKVSLTAAEMYNEGCKAPENVKKYWSRFLGYIQREDWKGFFTDLLQQYATDRKGQRFFLPRAIAELYATLDTLTSEEKISFVLAYIAGACSK